MARSPNYIDKQLRTLKDFFSSIGMTINTNKTKLMIMKSQKITYDNIMYDKNNLEEVAQYKYLRIDLHHKLKKNHNIDKWIN